MTKYGAKKITIDDIIFDSKMEGEYYKYLKQCKVNSEIQDFTLQPEFILQPKFEKDNKKYLPIKYKADFKVIGNDGITTIIDVKGFTTTDFKIKEKMFNYQYKEKLKLITYSKIDGGWIELKQLALNRKERKANKNKK